MRFSSVSLKRLGLCFGALILLSIYATTAAQIRLNLYLPIGLLLMSAYVWLVIKKFKNIYPVATKAIGQLCLTFLILGLSSSRQLNQMMESIGPRGEGIENKVFSAAIHYAVSTIAAHMERKQRGRKQRGQPLTWDKDDET
jgi:hypothetical protein